MKEKREEKVVQFDQGKRGGVLLYRNAATTFARGGGVPLVIKDSNVGGKGSFLNSSRERPPARLERRRSVRGRREKSIQKSHALKGGSPDSVSEGKQYERM